MTSFYDQYWREKNALTALRTQLAEAERERDGYFEAMRQTSLLLADARKEVGDLADQIDGCYHNWKAECEKVLRLVELREITKAYIEGYESTGATCFTLRAALATVSDITQGSAK